MQTLKSGNGVKVAKAVQEVIDVINNPNLKRVEKLEILRFSDFTGRPGRKEAEELHNDYFFKFKWFTNGKITGKSPRGVHFKMQRKWITAFQNYLHKVAPDVITNIYEYERKYNVKGEGIKPFATEIRKEIISAQAIKTIEKNKRADFVKLSGLPSHFFGNEKSILEVQNNKASNAYCGKYYYCIINGYYITVTQSESEDWEAYSKGWHKSHGPKRTINSREVNFYKDGKFNFQIDLKSFAGNYLIDAIIDVLKLEKVKANSKIQLNKYFSISLVRKVLNVEIYERKLADAHIDFCAFYNNETFHASTMAGTVSGLQKKLKANIYFDREKINKEVGYQLGFCETGMKEFCTDNDLDFDGTYSRKDLRNIVIANRADNCKKYASELKKIGIALNCK